MIFSAEQQEQQEQTGVRPWQGPSRCARYATSQRLKKVVGWVVQGLYEQEQQLKFWRMDLLLLLLVVVVVVSEEVEAAAVEKLLQSPPPPPPPLPRKCSPRPLLCHRRRRRRRRHLVSHLEDQNRHLVVLLQREWGREEGDWAVLVRSSNYFRVKVCCWPGA